MKSFQIITDSGCDMPGEYFAQKGVECIRLGFVMDGVEYQGENGAEIALSDFYDKLRGGALPTTYQATSETVKDVMRKYLEAGTDVLAIAFSSGLSGTANSYVVAQRELLEEYPQRKIFVVDSLCASLGQGLLLHYVVEKAESGASIEDTYLYAQELKLSISHQLTVYDLFHLKRGGRVSATTAVVGSMMNIKPMLHVSDEGKLVPIGKVMGRKKSLHRLVENMQATMDISHSDPIFISHADCLEDAECLKNLLLKNFPNNRIFIHYIGPVIGSHAGCGTVALFFKAKHR